MTMPPSGHEGLELGLVLTALAFGLRHGVDWDHIAAIGDITASQLRTRAAMLFCTLYAVGHAVVVFALGLVAIIAGGLLSPRLDAAMGRVVGVTLVGMGLYVFYSLARYGSDFRMESRWMLLISAVRRIAHRPRRRRARVTYEVIEHDHEHPAGARHGHRHAHAPVPVSGATQLPGSTHRHRHRHVVPVPADPFRTYGKGASLALGMLHGIGAETPTQIALFVTAAGVGGSGRGAVLLGIFVLGLLVANTLVALASSLGYRRAAGDRRLYVAIAAVTAAFSLITGALLLVDEGDVLPALFGG